MIASPTFGGLSCARGLVLIFRPNKVEVRDIVTNLFPHPISFNQIYSRFLLFRLPPSNPPKLSISVDSATLALCSIL
jgi:hypothetical protein